MSFLEIPWIFPLPPSYARVFSTSDLMVYTFWSKILRFAVTLMMDLHVKLCRENLSDETIFWQAAFFSMELSVSATAKNHKNRVLTLLRDRDVSDDFDVFDFSKLQNAKSIGKISTPKSVKTPFLCFFAIAETLSLTLKSPFVKRLFHLGEILYTTLHANRGCGY